MLRLIISIFFFFLIQSDRQPIFEDYSVRVVFKGKPVQIQSFSKKYYGAFRTKKELERALQKAVSEGCNFSDHYTIVEWPDGTTSFEFAIIDAKSGKIYFGKDLIDELVFKRNSRLLISNPIDSAYYQRLHGKIPEYQYSVFYEWTGDSLKKIYATPKPIQYEYKVIDNIINPK